MCKLARNEKRCWLVSDSSSSYAELWGLCCSREGLKILLSLKCWKAALSHTPLTQAGLHAPEQRGKGKQLSSSSLKGADRNAKFN